MTRKGFIKRILTTAAALVAAPLTALAREPVVQAEDFGAVGDDFHDDTRAIQAAIDYAATTNRKVQLGAGTYAVTRLSCTAGCRGIVGPGSLRCITTKGSVRLNFDGNNVIKDNIVRS